MASEYNYKGHLFQIEQVSPYVSKVAYEGHTGYVGVNVNGTAKEPYTWAFADDPVSIADKGLVSLSILRDGSTINEVLDMLCSRIVDQHEEKQSRNAFQPEKASEQLKHFMDSLAKKGKGQ